MPQEVLPFTLIPISIHPSVDSIPVGFAIFPLTDEALTIDALPDSATFLFSIFPLAIKNLPVSPLIDTFTVRLTLGVLPLVHISVSKQLVPLSFPEVVPPSTLVDPPSVIDYHTFAMPLLLLVDLLDQLGSSLQVFLRDEAGRAGDAIGRVDEGFKWCINCHLVLYSSLLV